jgi:hypothetical protein
MAASSMKAVAVGLRFHTPVTICCRGVVIAYGLNGGQATKRKYQHKTVLQQPDQRQKQTEKVERVRLCEEVS